MADSIQQTALAVTPTHTDRIIEQQGGPIFTDGDGRRPTIARVVSGEQSYRWTCQWEEPSVSKMQILHLENSVEKMFRLSSQTVSSGVASTKFG